MVLNLEDIRVQVSRSLTICSIRRTEPALYDLTIFHLLVITQLSIAYCLYFWIDVASSSECALPDVQFSSFKCCHPVVFLAVQPDTIDKDDILDQQNHPAYLLLTYQRTPYLPIPQNNSPEIDKRQTKILKTKNQ